MANKSIDRPALQQFSQTTSNYIREEASTNSSTSEVFRTICSAISRQNSSQRQVSPKQIAVPADNFVISGPDEGVLDNELVDNSDLSESDGCILDAHNYNVSRPDERINEPAENFDVDMLGKH